MRGVRADVIEATNGNQRPRTDSVSKYSFADPELLAQRQKEATALQGSIEEQIVALQVQINSTKMKRLGRDCFLISKDSRPSKLRRVEVLNAEQAQRQAEIAAQTKALEEKEEGSGFCTD